MTKNRLGLGALLVALAIGVSPYAEAAVQFLLPVTRGGTGAASLDSAGIVTKANAQTLTGRKTGKFTLAAGTATAGTSPLKFTDGTSLTTAEDGAMEFSSDKLYFTPNVTIGRERLMTALDRKSTRLNSSHIPLSRMPSSA